MTTEPDWLTWTRELQAIAQTGLAFVRDPYDRERYGALRALASRIMAAHTSVSAERIETLFRARRATRLRRSTSVGPFSTVETACSWYASWQTVGDGRCREAGQT